ncbi:myo-inositol-1(or 4)-monophosphatase [Strigomonas culicis]|uniref:Inositol-1-monophosphatase n=1 Tax=Strigomonas culicis TaxID=28005 RepID=S9VY91_9TRYP|nr:myo-inositol-1(or 4)-monophosphatase [Strigomonas culicis]|eukprot:EPY32066.1 myo-inositol-1(or 4)-monophosphatase [Strigomonas culicis]
MVVSISETEINVAVDLATRAAAVASAIINKSIEERQSAMVETVAKTNSTDLVTMYDAQCEEEVINILKSGTPFYNILSEETRSDVELTNDPTWVVDPIDGTTSFVHGFYDCCVSIALVVNKEPILGVISAPRLQEIFTAVKGRGAFCNGQRIFVSESTTLEESVVFVHQSYNRSQRAVDSVIAIQTELAKLPVHSLRNNGAAALDMCFVAAGRAEMYFEVNIHAWDYAAGTIIVREAGGVVHDVDDTETYDLMRHGMCCGCCKEITAKGVELARKYDYRNAIMDL